MSDRIVPIRFSVNRRGRPRKIQNPLRSMRAEVDFHLARGKELAAEYLLRLCEVETGAADPVTGLKVTRGILTEMILVNHQAEIALERIQAYQKLSVIHN